MSLGFAGATLSFDQDISVRLIEFKDLGKGATRVVRSTRQFNLSKLEPLPL
jgi:hypothetical protein